MQRLNNRKRVRYVNTSADTDLSAGAWGLHKGLRTEDVTSDRAAVSMQTFSRSSGANGGWGRSRSSFVVGGVSYQPDVLISSQSLYHTPHIWDGTGGQPSRVWYLSGKTLADWVF